jgi:hypothetical protein
LLLRVKQDDTPARGIQFSDLLIEAENDLVSIGDELAAQAIDIGFAGLAFIGRSLAAGLLRRSGGTANIPGSTTASFSLTFLKATPSATLKPFGCEFGRASACIAGPALTSHGQRGSIGHRQPRRDTATPYRQRAGNVPN